MNAGVKIFDVVLHPKHGTLYLCHDVVTEVDTVRNVNTVTSSKYSHWFACTDENTSVVSRVGVHVEHFVGLKQ